MARLTPDVTLAPVDHLILATAHRGRAGWLLTFPCGWCQRTHAHGGGSATGPPEGGHRVSHCASDQAPAGYTLRIATVEGAISPLAPDHPKLLAFDRPPERRVPDGDEVA
jgi:hypothetical protein